MLDLFLIKTTKDRLASLSHENKFSKTKRSDDNGYAREQEYSYHRWQQRDRVGRSAGIRQRGRARRHLRLEWEDAEGGSRDAWRRKPCRSRGRQHSRGPRRARHHGQAELR